MKIAKNAAMFVLVAATVGVWFTVCLKASGIADHFVAPSSPSVRSCLTAEQKRSVKIGQYVTADVIRCWEE